MRIKRYDKIIKLSLLVSLIAFVNLNCAPLLLVVLEKPVYIENNIVELNTQLKGRIGFCSIPVYPIGYIPMTKTFRTEVRATNISYLHLEKLQSSFLDTIGNRELVDCNYEIFKDIDYRNALPQTSAEGGHL